MNLVEPYARLVSPDVPTNPFVIDDGIRCLRRIEYFGRFSHATEDAQTEESWQRFIPAVVMGHGDWSIVEHASATVDFRVDRGISHELVRHRLFSFTQSSTRFINYAKKMPASFIKPEMPEAVPEYYWEQVMTELENHYKQLLTWGCSPQIARSVFPNGLSTRVATTGNLRNWRHFLIMRTTRETHPQFRQVTIPLLEEFKRKIPILFEDIQPMDRQSEAIKKAR
jgi:thymidylate synthase (FAD)